MMTYRVCLSRATTLLDDDPRWRVRSPKMTCRVCLSRATTLLDDAPRWRMRSPMMTYMVCLSRATTLCQSRVTPAAGRRPALVGALAEDDL